jgi:hypothetical protein
MMLDRMGIIGNTQGVKASNRPKPKKLRITSQVLPLVSDSAMRSCSETDRVGRGQRRRFPGRQQGGRGGGRGRQLQLEGFLDGRIADAGFFGAALIGGGDADGDRLRTAAQQRYRGLDGVVIDLDVAKELVMFFLTHGQTHRAEPDFRIGGQLEPDLVAIHVVIGSDLPARHQGIGVGDHQVEAEGLIRIQYLVIVAADAERFAQGPEGRHGALGRWCAGGLRAGRGGQGEGDFPGDRGITHAEIGAALILGDQGEGLQAAVFPDQRGLAGDGMAVDFHPAEKLVLLDLAGREFRCPEADAGGIRFEADLVTIEVIAVGNLPFGFENIALDPGFEGKGLVRLQQFFLSLGNKAQQQQGQQQD